MNIKIIVLVHTQNLSTSETLLMSLEKDSFVPIILSVSDKLIEVPQDLQLVIRKEFSNYTNIHASWFNFKPLLNRIYNKELHLVYTCIVPIDLEQPKNKYYWFNADLACNTDEYIPYGISPAQLTSL